ncbi:hypothetical protein N7495_004939 [Penicillium taxi]|uniref:uncharacterized protein n=1 Tax=Penicillium taxi TaxID=168475 RepID=UPI002544D805|nr:uncharacterized protein N7495_004939 [Penicillium taxi]KAJ5893248.1 hypothetical protein N7495_004939 [Penicillium taxi]
MAISSNEKRALERKKCREALAAHIRKSLDGYAWSVTEPNKHLLQSSLSGGNIRLYRSICEELGRSLKAVTPETLQTSPSDHKSSAEEVREKDPEPQYGDERGNVSFTTQIRDLESINCDLGVELDQTRSHLERSLSESHNLKIEITRLQTQL